MQIARDLYEGLIIGRDISKPIVAQRFAAALEDAPDLDKDSLSDKDSTGYLIDAIHYATSLNNNQ